MCAWTSGEGISGWKVPPSLLFVTFKQITLKGKSPSATSTRSWTDRGKAEGRQPPASTALPCLSSKHTRARGASEDTQGAGSRTPWRSPGAGHRAEPTGHGAAERSKAEDRTPRPGSRPHLLQVLAQLGRHVHLPVLGEVADGLQEVSEARLHVLHVRARPGGPQRADRDSDGGLPNQPATAPGAILLFPPGKCECAGGARR